MTKRPSLCPYVQGVLFGFRRGEQEVQGLVLAEALQSAFNVDARPQSWLTAFDENEQAIVAAAMERYDKHSGDFVVVGTLDIGPQVSLAERRPV